MKLCYKAVFSVPYQNNYFSSLLSLDFLYFGFSPLLWRKKTLKNKLGENYVEFKATEWAKKQTRLKLYVSVEMAKSSLQN